MDPNLEPDLASEFNPKGMTFEAMDAAALNWTETSMLKLVYRYGGRVSKMLSSAPSHGVAHQRACRVVADRPRC